ncbi:hypothetical protein ACFE04_024877 [Oxalis oulophora]
MSLDSSLELFSHHSSLGSSSCGRDKIETPDQDNMSDLYQRACSIFSSKSELQIAQCFAKDLTDNSPEQLSEGVLLELQIYGFSDLVEGTDKKNDESMRQSESGSSEIKESSPGRDPFTFMKGPAYMNFLTYYEEPYKRILFVPWL